MPEKNNMQKVLITGCSYSVNNTQSGWQESNLCNTYHSMLQTKRGWHITNRAMGGCSNREIAQRTIDSCLAEHYDFCVVQWSSLHRFWIYESECNIDDETQILPSVCGKLTAGNAPHILKKILMTHYLNDYMALKHWLHDQVALQSFLDQRRIRHIFIKGFYNYVPELEILAQQWPKEHILDLQIPDSIKLMLQFDNNPNRYLHADSGHHYLHCRLSALIRAYLAIDKSHCIGYNQSDMIYGLDTILERDTADDGSHPGRIVNAALSAAILNHVDQRQTH